MARWVRVEAFKGGQVVRCGLCGKRICKRTFFADDTNYAEALRLAVAFAWRHEHSEEHRAALAAYHSPEPPEPDAQHELLNRIFGYRPPPAEKELRKRDAKQAAYRVLRTAKNPAQTEV